MICRCCEGKFDLKPILRFENMPTSAQGFLDEREIESDKGEELHLFQCPYCGLVQLAGKPVPYFRDVIRASAVSDEMREFRTHYFKDFVDKYCLVGKKIIEIGCGCGEFLELMNLTGANGFGIEHKRESVEKCVQKNLRVFEFFLEKENDVLREAPYDGFFIMNFLEHIPDPNAFLKAIFHNLSEDAMGLVEVPNFDMILRKKMFSEFISDHLMYFTQDTLGLLLEKNGFEVLDCYPVWHDYCLAGVVKKKSGFMLDELYASMDNVSRELNSFVDKIHNQGGEIAVWGAGHQALTVIALCKIEKKIKFIVDSADFKQGKYTPGTHIKIVSPDALRHDNIQAVVVMAASYSDEVANILRRDFSGAEIAILRDYGLEYYN